MPGLFIVPVAEPSHMTVPLQLPGGMELLVVLMIFLIPAAFLVAIVGGVVYLLRRRSGRLEELESRIEELEAEMRKRE